jgi:hypothetical protein
MDVSRNPAETNVPVNGRGSDRPMFWTTLLFCNVVTGVLSVILARKYKKSALFWFLLTLPLGVLALFLLLALPEEGPDS